MIVKQRSRGVVGKGADRFGIIVGISVLLANYVVRPALGQVETEDVKVVLADGAAFDSFGRSVALSDNTAFVGAGGDDHAGPTSGSVSLFGTMTGNNLLTLTASGNGALDNFSRVAVSGTTAVVGAIGDLSGADAGAAYLFDTTTGQQLFTLVAADATPGDRFGDSVAISGTIAIVGAPFDDDADERIGSAYLFDTTTGQQIHKLIAPDGGRDDRFGSSVGISGTTAIIGAPNDDDQGSNTGSAYLFDTTSGDLIARLDSNFIGKFGAFGSSVAIDGATAIVGRPAGQSSGFGSAHLFDVATGERLPTLTASGGDFGSSVAIEGSIAIVGAPRTRLGAGSAYVFDIRTGQQLAELTASDAARDDIFGWSVSVSGATVLVGAPGNDDGGSSSGAAYLFHLILPCNAADLASAFGILNIDDVLTFLAAFSTADPVADFALPSGSFDIDDVLGFLAVFTGGCP